MRNRISNFHAQNSGVPQVRLLNLVAGAVNTAAKSLDPEKIAILFLPSQSFQISAVTAAQIHFDRSGPRKHFGRRDWTKIIRGNKFHGRGSTRNPALLSHSFR